MSTFGGKIQEIPNISVDRFDNENIDSEAYFLSHCHTDHMVGLDCAFFREQLVKKNKYLYASHISCEILKQMYPNIKNNLKELDLNVSYSIFLKNNSFCVTLITAGHCPGSVMFLFESDLRILYTGDYRISGNDIKKFDVFFDKFQQIKVIDKLYLDTTFFLKKFLRFPKREESLEELISCIQEWIKKGNKYHINLKTSAKYGSEYLFNEIYKRLKLPVHVGSEAFEFYSLVPEMDKSITLDGDLTSIHSSSCNCYSSLFWVFCKDIKVKVRNIKVSALRWTQENLSEKNIQLQEDDDKYICYSTHASLEEGMTLLNFLKPKKIEACVLHRDSESNKEIMENIDDFLTQNKTDLEKEKVKESPPKLFNTKSVCMKKPKKRQNDFSELLDSPPRENIKRCNLLAENQSTIDYNVTKENNICGDTNKLDNYKESDNETPENLLLNILSSSASSAPSTSTQHNLDLDEIDEDNVLINIINYRPN